MEFKTFSTIRSKRPFKIAILSKQLVINIALPKIEWVFELDFIDTKNV